MKRFAQQRITQLSYFCSEFLRESSKELEMENPFEMSSLLQAALEELSIKHTALSNQLENMVC